MKDLNIPDVINGNQGEDIVIGATTIHDSNLIALSAIRDEWTSNRTLAERIANIEGSGVGPRLNSVYFLNGMTVQDDGESDLLDGGLSPDWIFVSVSDDDFIIGMNDVLNSL